MRRHIATGIFALCAGLFALSANQASAQSPLQDLPAAGDAGGQAFAGAVTVTEFAVSAAGQLLLTGNVVGTATDPSTGAATEVQQAFQAVPAALGGANEAGVCDILFLDIQPISLDLLGLQLDLSQIQLDLDAAPGAGRLVGNLLCAVTGLLDGFAIAPLLVGILQSIIDALNGLLQQ
jgi:hypothetical protein